MNNLTSIFFRYRFIWHFLFWFVWYIFYSITYTSPVNIDKSQFLMNLYLLPVRIIFTYIFIYWIIPSFLFTKKYLLFIIIAILHAIVFGLSIVLIFIWLRIPEPGNFPFIRPIILNYQIPATAAAIIIFKKWYLMQQYSLKLEKEKLEAELNFLKSQIHPHFLFNTLNNLYALTLKKSDKAPEVVVQLSNMLDHMLYSKANEVCLEKEIVQLKDYIRLEQINYGDRLKLTIDISGDTKDKKIAPLIMLPFIENSFKHGASNDIQSPFIRIKIDMQETKFHFEIENSYELHSVEKGSYSEGIGLNNVKRRLELLYPDMFQLKINNNDRVFQVSLDIDLGNGTLKNLKNQKLK